MTGVDHLIRRGVKKLQRMSMATLDVPIAAEEISSGQVVVEEKLGSRNLLGLLKNFSMEGVRYMLCSSNDIVCLIHSLRVCIDLCFV